MYHNDRIMTPLKPHVWKKSGSQVNPLKTIMYLFLETLPAVTFLKSKY